MKIALAILIAFAIGFACGWFEIPAPAPPTLIGAALVMAMSVGYMTGSKMRTPATVAPAAAIRSENKIL